MPVKLALQILRRFLHAAQSTRRSRKLLPASSAFGNTGCRANMFHDANRAFRHLHSLPQTCPRAPFSLN